MGKPSGSAMNLNESGQDPARSAQRTGGSRNMSQLRLHCFDASMIEHRNRSSFEGPGSTTLRSVTIGINRSSPSSVAFSTSQSSRSPLGAADASVRWNGGERSGNGDFHHDQIDPIVAHGDDLRSGCAASSIKHFDDVAGPEPADSGQVFGLARFEALAAITWGIGTIEPDRHAQSPELVKDWSHPIRS